MPLSRTPPSLPGTTSAPHTAYRAVLAASWLAYATFYFPRLAFAASKLGLLSDSSLAVTRSFLGIADALFLALYALGQFLWGAVAERWGPRRLVVAGLLGAAAAALILAGATHPTLILVALAVQGVVQATGWVAVCSDVAAHTPPTRRGFAFGILSTSYAFGALAAPLVLGWTAYTLTGSWRAAPLSSAVITLLALVTYSVWLRPWPARTSHLAHPTTYPDPLASAIHAESARPAATVWLLSIADFLLKPVIYATVFWTPVLVRDALPTLTSSAATALAGVLGLAGLASPVLAGFLSDRAFHGQRGLPAILGLAGCTIMLVAFPLAAASGRWWLLALALLFLGTALYAAESLIVGVAAAEAGGTRAAQAVGIVNGVGSFGGILGGLVPGFLSGPHLFALLAAMSLLAIPLLLPLLRRERQRRMETTPRSGQRSPE